MAAEDDPNCSDLASVNGMGELPSGAMKQYWRWVEETLVAAFGRTPTEAKGLADAFRGRLQKELEQDFEVALYHLDPFQVAADLAGLSGEAVQPSQKAKYIAAVRQLPVSDRPDGADFDQSVPDEPRLRARRVAPFLPST